MAAKIRRTARATLQSQGFGDGSLEIAVVGQRQMCRLHRLWLGHDAATDVLSFDLRECPRPGQVDGQVVVCAAVARRAAQAHDTDWRGELLLYVVHGCLHLCGFDDLRPHGAARMHKEEDRLLTALGWGPIFSGARPAPAAAMSACRPPGDKRPKRPCRKSRQS